MSFLSSALGLAGSIFGSNASAKQASENRDWQEYMYRNRHQMEVADLRSAGLNPILSANSAGSVPSGATGMVQDMSGVGNTYNSARQIDQVQRKQVENETALKDSQVRKNDSDIGLNSVTGREKEANIATQGTVQAVNTAQANKIIADEKLSNANAAYSLAKILNENRLTDAQVNMYHANALHSAGQVDYLKQQGIYVNKQGQLVDRQSEGHKYDNVIKRSNSSAYEGSTDKGSFFYDSGWQPHLRKWLSAPWPH